MYINSASSAVIKSWQEFLDEQGFSAGTPDGIWGKNSESATKAFQKAEGLPADGIAGKQTMEAAEKKGFKLPTPQGFEPAGTSNTVFDISHNQGGQVDFAAAKAAGMQALFHKATQYTNFHDSKYASRRASAKAAGLLWGAYHFGAEGDGTAQADYFLDYAKPDGSTLLVLDFEANPLKHEGNMTISQAEAFVNRVKDKTGKYPGLYGGSYLKEHIGSQGNSTLSRCWLWLSEYGSKTRLPVGWSDYTFWQYTDGAIGPGAVPVPGIGQCDRSVFNGTAEELKSFWSNHGV